MGASEEVIKEFISVTGADHGTAKHFLDACSNNLETAVTMFLDGKTDGVNPDVAAVAGSSSNPDNVRSPIPQTSGVLVDDLHYGSTSNTRWRPRRKARSVFDGFRDFKDEMKEPEVLSSNPAKRRRMKRLEDLFRPPMELMHRGSFETARETGKKEQKWLMVNVQNVQEFSCQVLNRDVWSKPQIQRKIKEHFVFWQVYTDSPDGQRFMTFYTVQSWPHVSIIDPRTGERLVIWSKVSAESISGKIEEFLADHGTIDEEESGPPNKRRKSDPSLMDDSEDSQLAAAIAASLKEAKTEPATDDSFVPSENSDVSELDASDEEPTTPDDISESEYVKLGHKMASGGGKKRSKMTSTTVVSGTKMASHNENLTQNGDSQLSNFSDIESTKVEGDYFSIKKSPECVENIPKMNGNCLKREHSRQNVTNVNKNEPKRVEKEAESSPKDMQYTKVKSKGLRLGSIQNGKDLSNLTKDKYIDEKTKKTCVRDEPPPPQEELCQIMVRLPDGSREQITLSSDLMIEHLQLKLEEKGFPPDNYEIVTNFPRKNLSTSGCGKTLKQLGLHPRAAVFVEEKE